MAKPATAKNGSDDKKKKKTKKTGGDAAVRVKAKKEGKSAKADRKAEGKSAKREGFEGLAKLVDHPLVADLLAAGAIAAVTAIAEHRLGKDQTSSKMVKSVGKAAAAAMGKRLMGDLGAVTDAAVDAAKKA
jgi:hypothetical protein